MVVQVLGPGCANCKKLFSPAEPAVKELNIKAQMEKITDINVIVGFGVMRTPAIAIDGVVKASGRVPKLDEIKAILQGAKA